MNSPPLWRATLTPAQLAHAAHAHNFKGDPAYGWVADLLDNKVAVAKTFTIDWGLSYNTDADTITHCKEIAAAVTPTSTNEAIALIGVSGSDIQLG